MDTTNFKMLWLKAKGYHPVYIWHGKSGERDDDHKHDFDTYLFIIEGELSINMNGKTVILHNMDEFTIPRDTVHCATVGENGCSYIVGEKH